MSFYIQVDFRQELNEEKLMMNFSNTKTFFDKDPVKSNEKPCSQDSM